MPSFAHDDIRFHYELSGEGFPLVLSHGLTRDLEQPKELVGVVPGYQLVLWDARGHGKTVPVGPAANFTFDRFAQDLAALLDHLRINEAVIGGISMGAAVSTRFTVRYPERVRGLVLIRPAWLQKPLPDGLRLYPIVADYLVRFGAEKGCLMLEGLPDYQTIRSRFPEAAANLRDQFFQEAAVDRRGRLEGIPRDAPIRSWSEVETLQSPALVLGNEPDLVHPLSYAMTWAERLPYGRFVQVPSRSLHFEEHARKVRISLTTFLDSLHPPPQGPHLKGSSKASW